MLPTLKGLKGILDSEPFCALVCSALDILISLQQKHTVFSAATVNHNEADAMLSAPKSRVFSRKTKETTDFN